MLNSSEFTYKPYKDSRVKHRPGFIVGRSGRLLLATHQRTGKKYLVKHIYPHNAANEYVACWLAERMGAPTPKAYLLTPNDAFETKYAVAIEYIDGFRRFDTVPEELKPDVISQLALCLMLYLDDGIQQSSTVDRIYAYDFSEGFNNVEMQRILSAGDDAMIRTLRSRLQQFKHFVENEDFDVPGLADDYGLESEELKGGMIAAVKRTATITDEEINEMTDELMEMYPAAVAVYYEGCIQAIREKARKLDNDII